MGQWLPQAPVLLSQDHFPPSILVIFDPVEFMKTTFSRKNYYLLIGGAGLLALGYLLMVGGGSEDPKVFNPDIFSFRRITLAPLVCLAGFVMIIVAIMWRP